MRTPLSLSRRNHPALWRYNGGLWPGSGQRILVREHLDREHDGAPRRDGWPSPSLSGLRCLWRRCLWRPTMAKVHGSKGRQLLAVYLILAVSLYFDPRLWSKSNIINHLASIPLGNLRTFQTGIQFAT